MKKNNLMNLTSTQKATVLFVLFLLASAWSWMFKVTDTANALPLTLFYLTITINTFFSVKLFSSIIPPGDPIQIIIDTILILLYFVMAFFLGNPITFVFFTLLLFITASTKYSFLLNQLPHPRLLKKKILIDLSGVLMSTLTLGGIILGYSWISTWAFSIVFIIANILLFFVWPLYRPDTKTVS